MKIKFIPLESFNIIDCKSILEFKNWKDYLWFFKPLEKSGHKVFMTYNDYAYTDIDGIWMKCRIPKNVRK
jgi:hypothetical protein